MKKYRSKLERTFAAMHPTLPYENTRLEYVQVHHYTPDFQLGPNHFVEVKGLFSSADRGKHLQIEWTGFALHIDDKLRPKRKPEPEDVAGLVDVRVDGAAVEFLGAR